MLLLMNHKNFSFTLVLILLVALKLQSTTLRFDSISFLFQLQTSLISSNFTSLSFLKLVNELSASRLRTPLYVKKTFLLYKDPVLATHREARVIDLLQKGGVPATPSGTATLLRLSPSHQFRPRPLLSVTNFRRPRLPWLDGRCVQGPGTYSPRHG